MESLSSLTLFLFYSLISMFFLRLAISARDTITPTTSLTDGETLVSSGQVFELGFFSPKNSKNRYLGIWYKTTPDVVLWVANRDDPLSNSFGELAITMSNRLVLLNRSKTVVWSSSSAKRVTGKTVLAQLLESGNLVLRDSELYLWQSFDYPTDTHLAGMKLGWDSNLSFERYLTTWKSPDDPSTGDFTYRVVIQGPPQFVVAMGATRKYRSGTWNGLRFGGRDVLTGTIFKSVVVLNDDESYYMFEPIVSSVATRMTLNVSGSLQVLTLQKGSTEWALMYQMPYQPCDSYGYCGANGICGVSKDPSCDCLEGFSPSSKQEWELLNWAKGCKRKVPLDCRKGEGFLKVVGVKLPDLVDFWFDNNMSLKECREECLKNCSCIAYANMDIRRGGSGCLMWFGDLIDIKEIDVKGSEQDIYIRLSASEINSIHDANKKKRLQPILVVAAVLSLCIFVLVLLLIIWKSRRKKRGQSKNEDIELPLFDLATMAAATNNFSDTSAIGEGGFGRVYKGSFSTGQEIAVKRLSNNSRQGTEEFKNEVVLIDFNTEILLSFWAAAFKGEKGCPNRSTSLDWEKRLNITMGIARGLLYLHQDSKLQIIHRDLKASNILLDSNMNPKISDFGLARIFRGDEKETKTERVVGTYGYMSPEYAVDGKFSVKSDVFSFGVVLLEIVSGKRNRGFSHPDHHHNLLGHAWLLWNEDKALELVDPFLEESSIESQVLRCIQVGLLCVQKFPADRPTMASVVVMLWNQKAELPWPKEPAFFLERSTIDEDMKSRKEELYTPNQTSTTLLEGR